MGVLYAIVGFLIFSVKNFMNLDLSAKITLILGSTLIAYGVFRIFRGVMSILRRNN